MDFKCLLILSLLTAFASPAEPATEDPSVWPALPVNEKAPEYEFIYKEDPIQQKNLVHKMFPYLDRDELKNTVDTLSSSKNREKPSDDGESFLEDEIRKTLAKYNGSSVFFQKIESSSNPKSYATPNLIAKLEGEDLLLKNEIVILSAHYDRVEASPGADDNYSGCAVLLEVLRLVAKFSLKFKHSVEFHFYAGNKAATPFAGSSDVAKKYSDDKVLIKGLLNMDSVGNFAERYGRALGLVTKLEIDGKLMESPPSFEGFVKKLIKQYSKEEAVELECNKRGCHSDHLSWHKRDYPWAFVTEVEASPHIDTEKDTGDTVDIEQVLEFAKVALAFVIESGELVEVPDIDHLIAGGHQESLASVLKPTVGGIWICVGIVGCVVSTATTKLI